MTQHMLVCPPTWFTVDYEINPWMHKDDQVDPAIAMRQFRKLVALYRRLGCTIATIPPAKGLPDMVFTANGAVVRGKTAVIANFRYAQRRAETPLFARWFRARGFRVVRMPRAAILEGQGEAFFVNGRLFAGYGFRANRASHRVLARVFGTPVVSLKLVDPRWYHLDTCFCPLARGMVLYYPGAFDAASRARIRKFTTRAIPVSRSEALDFVCNSVPIGDTLVTGSHPSAKTVRALERIGYSVITVPLGEFKKSGGGARCLTLNI
jgi:N-dimethylarginine dimethylaminohydrolase